jgi:hypothetical protein
LLSPLTVRFFSRESCANTNGVIEADAPITPSIVNARSHVGNAHYVSA